MSQHAAVGLCFVSVNADYVCSITAAAAVAVPTFCSGSDIGAGVQAVWRPNFCETFLRKVLKGCMHHVHRDLWAL